MNKQVKCIAHYYPTHKPDVPRNYSPATCAKLEYIFACLERAGTDVWVLSAGENRGREGSVEQVGEHLTVELLPCDRRGNPLERVLTGIKFRRLLGQRIDELVNDGDVVLVYHALSMMKHLKRLKTKKNVRLIVEVEEIYGDVSKKKRIAKREWKCLQLADAFVFPTESLNDKINQRQVPYAISHGTYTVVPPMGTKLFHDGLIHCVYAGTLDPRKGGAEAAIRMAEYLPQGYHVHILGFGTPQQIESVNRLIRQVSGRAVCQITYDGVLRGDEYLGFIQSCDVGLSTQNPEEAFNDTSFPSKILSYMANGLRVVSVRIPVVEKSGVHEYMYYYDEQTPEAIAAAVCAIDFSSSYDSRRIIEQLDGDFCRSIQRILNEL